jgi:photosystem II stability/assembly factor-like uncharacterized protein
MKRISSLIVISILCAAGASAQKPRARRPVGKTSSTRAEQPKFKAVFEPVNFDQDVKLFSVYCADEQSCWAAGGTSETRGGIIIHTSDAGDHWTIQTGDPQSDDYAFRDLRFVNEHLGFAVQRTGSASRLYRTEDGEHWLPVGKIAEHMDGYYYNSATNGVVAEGHTIKTTRDAGQTWMPVLTCSANVTVNGLARNVGCSFKSLSFPSPSTGYAAALSSDTHDNLFLAKTTDGGATWNVLTLDVHNDGPGPEDLCFVDDNTGFMRVGYGDTGKLYETSDGGKTWTAIAGAPGDTLRFASGKHAGWAFHYSHLGFTGDEGGHWSSRQESFPASPWDSTLPRTNFGLVVGEHGMIYRYRVVPASYMAKGMLAAPMFPGSSPKAPSAQ